MIYDIYSSQSAVDSLPKATRSFCFSNHNWLYSLSLIHNQPLRTRSEGRIETKQKAKWDTFDVDSDVHEKSSLNEVHITPPPLSAGLP